MASGHNVSYTVDVEKKTKGYDYNAKISGSKVVTLDSVKLNATKKQYGPKQGYKYTTKKYNKAYTFTIEANGTKTIVLESGKLNAIAKREIFKQLYNADQTVEKEVYNTVYDDDYKLNITGKKEIENPKTGDNIIYSYIFALISIIGVLLSTLNIKAFRKNN